jgi:hypothetical protein
MATLPRDFCRTIPTLPLLELILMQYKIISPESAYLALYRDSGVMMLIVNQDDIVYEKDLARTPLDAAKRA